jgi:hypothetical protein
VKTLDYSALMTGRNNMSASDRRLAAKRKNDYPQNAERTSIKDGRAR